MATLHPFSGISEPVASVSRAILKGSDEYHSVHATRLTRTAEILLQEIGDAKKALELGTSGYMALLCEELLPDLVFHGTHLDTSDNSKVRDVKFTVGGRSISVQAFNGDFEYGSFPVKDGSYDVVICCEVLEHMEIDPMHMLSEVNRVLCDGGLLILTTPNITSSRALANILSGVEPYFYMQYHRTREYNRHNFEYSAPTLGKVLKAAGFRGKIWSEDLFQDGIGSIVEKLRSCGFPVDQPGDNLISVSRKTSDVVSRYPSAIYV